MSASVSDTSIKAAWVVFLLTSPSYLPGILVLAHSLKKYNSAYPLIVAVNPALPKEAVQALKDYGLEVKVVEPLVPVGKVMTIAERFVDTWTKLRVFEFVEYDRLVLIDGDMMLRRNMDELMTMPLESDQIAATHACVCNLDKSSWAPEDWTRENCGFTLSHHPSALTNPTPASIPSSSPSSRTHSLLNSGLVPLTPSHTTMSRITTLLNSSSKTDQDLIASWMFPDQDLLAYVFEGKWISLAWCYNALKTMRYWHGNFWRDEEVRNLHYICDKPWKRRPGVANDEGGGSGKEGKYTVDAGEFEGIFDAKLGIPAEQADAVTHGWWWDEFDQMRAKMVKDEYAGLEVLDGLVAK